MKNKPLYFAGLYAMALLYLLAGINHFVHPETYLRIMPPYVPQHALVVALSGIAEIILGILLLPAVSRRYAGWGVIFLLIAVFPANVQMTIDWQRSGHAHLWIAWVRLPLQLVLIAWAYVYAKRRPA